MRDVANVDARDCRAPGPDGGPMPVDQAMRFAVSLAVPVEGTDLVGLREAVGRVLACDLRAPRPMPFFDNSAMDGFAVRLADLTGEGPWEFAVLDTIAAGAHAHLGSHAFPGAVRIFTGAPVPNGFDAVVMKEECTDRGDRVTLSRRPSAGANIRLGGEDIPRGAILARAGTRLDPRRVGLLAANGYGAVNVVRRLRLGIFSTGDELAEPGEAVPPHAIYDANRPMLMSLAEALGADIIDLGRVCDDLEATVDFIGSLRRLGLDLVISSGAVSVGSRDFVRPALEHSGGRVENWRVALKPGKPIMFGRLGRTLFTGLPGNPLAAWVGFQLFVSAQMAALCGEPLRPFATASVCAGFERRKAIGRTEYLPARVRQVGRDGLPVVDPVGRGGSASLFPLCAADGMCIVPAGASVSYGDRLAWQPFQ